MQQRKSNFSGTVDVSDFLDPKCKIQFKFTVAAIVAAWIDTAEGVTASWLVGYHRNTLSYYICSLQQGLFPVCPSQPLAPGAVHKRSHHTFFFLKLWNQIPLQVAL